MSCNYADGLSAYDNKGKLGLPEIKDEAHIVDEKVKKLVQWIKEARHVVFHTGAGISTQAGIPDFRGPNGVWTLEKKGEKPNINTSFDKAEPTLTHLTIKSLIEKGYAKFVISQNIDGLHLKSGIKRTCMAELHGNMFVAKCVYCEKYAILEAAASTVGEKPLGLDCPFDKAGGRSCRGKLHDTLLDWEANLPPNELESAFLHSTLADLSICLGTTLQIVPAGNLPLKAKKNPGGRLVIVNLQNTKHDKKADLVINSYVDDIMRKIAESLGILPIPKYSSEIDPTKLLSISTERKRKVLMDWTIPTSSIKQLRNQVKNQSATNKKEHIIKPPPKKRSKKSTNISEDSPSPCQNFNQEVPARNTDKNISTVTTISETPSTSEEKVDFSSQIESDVKPFEVLLLKQNKKDESLEPRLKNLTQTEETENTTSKNLKLISVPDPEQLLY